LITRSVTLSSSSGWDATCGTAREGNEVTVNAIMPFSILALLWVVLTVGAAIVALIAPLFTRN
jgi:hypothetical protein